MTRPKGSFKTESVSGKARAAGVKPKTALARLARGWPEHTVFSLPITHQPVESFAVPIVSTTDSQPKG